MTQQYELMFIVPGSLDDAQVPEIKNRVLTFINEAQATVGTDVDLGRRRLAYQIKRQTTGHYFVLQFTAEQDAVAALDKKLRLDAEILRYLLIKASVRSAEDIKAMLAEPERTQVVVEEPAVAEPTAPVQAQVQAEEFGPTVKRDDPAPGETKNVTDAEEVEAEPVAEAATTTEEEDPIKSIEELDKKLDALLDDTNIKL